MNVIYKIGRQLMLGLFAGILLACSSGGTRSNGAYYNTHYYDTYYRSGINNHHNRNYRRPRPVQRPARRR
jgi:hypothetical protein